MEEVEMDLLKKPDGDMSIFSAFCIAAGWMTGWAFAFLISSQLQIEYTKAFGIIYGTLVVLTVVVAWEHATYWNRILRINELMHR